MEFLSITEIWKYLKWLPKFFLRKIFSKERLADLVIFDVKPRHQSVSVNLGDVASYDIYFQIINMSPFSIELDRAEIDFRYAGTQLKSQYIKKAKFSPGQIGTLHVSDEIESSKADQIAKHFKINNSYMEMHIEFNCKLHNFKKILSNLDGINPEYKNSDRRVEKLENA